MTDVYRRLTDHIDDFWPRNRKARVTWPVGPIHLSLPNFSVLRIAPRSEREPWVYLTVGAWEADAGQKYRSEFFLVSPWEDRRNVETLSMLAHHHADPTQRIELGSSFRIGRPWLDGSRLDHLLISLPYPYGPELEFCSLGKELQVRYLWVLPITRSEHQFRCRAGLEALEQQLEAAGINYLDPDRDSAI